jgi:hypothetical protein
MTSGDAVASRRSRADIGNSVALVGSALGIVAGAVQLMVGDDIASWTGNKASAAALGLLTVVLSSIAGLAVLRLRRTTNPPGTQLALVVLVAVIALVCFSSVGRLWFVPGPLLLIGAGLQLPGWNESVSVTRQNWPRVLLAALGAFELLMAAGATTVAAIIGLVGAGALIAAACLAGGNRRAVAGLLVLGTIPFAVAAWTALVPVLMLVVVAVLAVPVMQPIRAHTNT